MIHSSYSTVEIYQGHTDERNLRINRLSMDAGTSAE